MARTAHGDVFDPAEVSAFHCINCCVRRGPASSARAFAVSGDWKNHLGGQIDDEVLAIAGEAMARFDYL